MRIVLVVFMLSAQPVWADGSGAGAPAEPIDATTLTVAELLALAAAERERADPSGCCDWGGLGCMPHESRR